MPLIHRSVTTRPRAHLVMVPTLLVALLATVLISSPARAVLGGVTADWPAASLTNGSSAVVTGRVTGLELGDGVALRQKVLGGWRTVERAAVGSDGSYRLRIPTWWIGERSYRVETTSLLGVHSETWTVTVSPSYRPKGRESQHAYSLSQPTRWDPCTVIGYRVNKRQAAKGWKRDVKGAIRRISEATGYRFAYRGKTRRYPQADSNNWYPADTALVIAWAKPRNSSLLRKYPGADGVGAALSSGGYYNGDGSSTYRIKKGMVVIDSRARHKRGFGSGITRGEVLMHEVGHAMGLAHTGSRKQVMYPYLTTRKARFGRGDLTGMRKRGATLGCVTQSSTQARLASERLVALP